jgi:hypothetical protein
MTILDALIEGITQEPILCSVVRQDALGGIIETQFCQQTVPQFTVETCGCQPVGAVAGAAAGAADADGSIVPSDMPSIMPSMQPSVVGGDMDTTTPPTGTTPDLGAGADNAPTPFPQNTNNGNEFGEPTQTPTSAAAVATSSAAVVAVGSIVMMMM